MFRSRIASGAAVILGVVAFLFFFSVYLRSPFTVPLRADQRIVRQGFYSVERNGDLVFVWTGPHAEFTVPAIDRSIDWRVTIDMKVWRPPGVPLPNVRIGVDGVTVAEQMIKGDFALAATAPRRTDARGITVSIDTTPAFQPGPGDTRKLGVAVASMTLEPIGGVPGVPRRAAAFGVAAIVILATVVAALGAPSLWVAAFAILAAWGEAALLARGVGPYGHYASQVLVLAAGLGSGLLAAVWSVEKLRRQRLSAAAIGVVAICLGACYLKLLMLLHPDMPIGDGVFHAHRFEYVLAGRLYFTSLTPDNYAFPYPIFLYLVAAPFAWLTSDTLDRLALLRIIATVADAAAAAMLYWMIVRATSDRLAGIACVVWYHAMPMTAWIMTWGALTNAFAQTLFVASLALVVALPVESTRRSTVALLTIFVSAALLTHPSTCAILVAVLAAASALYAWHGGKLGPAATGVVLAAASATAIAVVLYYGWFPSVYVSELGRAASASVSTASAPAESLGARLAKAARLGETYFGWPAVAVAAIGAWRLSQNSLSPRLTLLLVGWASICLVFLAVGIVTPIEMRYHFAAFPALAIAAAFGCSWAWRSGAMVRLAMSALVVAGVWDGVAQWLWAMTTYARIVR
jgi:hypothetical protein